MLYGNFGAIVRPYLEYSVLILIFLENALRLIIEEEDYILYKDVLILIFLENALRHYLIYL